MLARELLAKNVTAMRIRREMSIRALADAAGISKDGLRQILGPGSNPTLDSLAVLAAALGVPIAELFADPPLAPPPPLKRGRKKKDLR